MAVQTKLYFEIYLCRPNVKNPAFLRKHGKQKRENEQNTVGTYYRLLDGIYIIGMKIYIRVTFLLSILYPIDLNYFPT